jgi:hypothetical protein
MSPNPISTCAGIGLSYPSAIGIYRGGNGNLVSHNEVHNCSYSAINYGGRSNIVENNLLYDCMKVLHDGAAIYMFAARDCILRQNEMSSSPPARSALKTRTRSVSGQKTCSTAAWGESSGRGCGTMQTPVLSRGRPERR